MNWAHRLRAENLAIADAQKAITRCARCRWYFQGTVAEGKRNFNSHRKLRHKEAT